MVKRSLALQLDEAVQAMLVSLRPRPEEAPESNLAALVRVAQRYNPICKGEHP
jgi:hypothetical protein